MEFGGSGFEKKQRRPKKKRNHHHSHCTMDAAEATRKQALQTKLKECLADLELAKSKQYTTPTERSKELRRIGRKIRHCREAIDNIKRVREGYRQRKQRQRENQRTSITPMINPNDNNGPRDLAIRRNGDGNQVRVGVSFLSCLVVPRRVMSTAYLRAVVNTYCFS
jgi:hypothetical protein